MSSEHINHEVSLNKGSYQLSLPPQAQHVLAAIIHLTNRGENQTNTNSIIAYLDSIMTISRRQSTYRIITYYYPLLRDNGVINYTSQRGATIEYRF